MASDRGVCECCQSEESRRVLKRLTREYATADGREVYRDMLMECFDIVVPSRAADGLICAACVTRLRDAASFKRLVLRSQRSLTETRKTAGTTSNAIKSETDGTLPEHVAFEAMDTDSRGFSDGDLIDKVKKEEPSSEDDAPLMRSLWHGREGSKAREVRRGPPVATVSAARSKMSTRETIDKLPNVLRETMRRLLSTTATSVRRKTTKAMDKTNGTATIKIPVKGSKMASTKCLKISLKPDYLLKSTQSKLAPTDLLKLTQSKMAKPTKKIESVPRVSECHASFYNAIMLLKSSNATPFRGHYAQGYKCYYCPNLYPDPDVLRRHTRDDHERERSNGTLYEYQLGRSDPSHFFMYLDIKNLQCTLCSQPMLDLNELRAHLKETHDKAMKTEYGDRNIPFVLTADSLHCQRCEEKFPSFRAIAAHMNTHYRNCICEVCGDGFFEMKRLNSHMQSHEKGRFPCGYCKKLFKCKPKLNLHETSVHKLAPRFKCPQCSERFYSYAKRCSHLVEKHNMAPIEYKCTICSKMFDSASNLNSHMKRDHWREKKIFCSMCSYTCHINCELKMHMIKHTGERIYKCDVCKKAYQRRKTLLEHMRIHNNDRRFACVVCGQAFVQNCSLKSHVKVHHPEVGYGSKISGKSSANSE